MNVSELMDFTNSLSREIADEKRALVALYKGGLAVANTDMVVTDGSSSQEISFAQAFGRLEGREESLNALAAFVITRNDDKRGKLEPPEA